ncbi:MAG: hypothetical protein Q9190_005623, partial [Brigantiaea leucoxantha]
MRIPFTKDTATTTQSTLTAIDLERNNNHNNNNTIIGHSSTHAPTANVPLPPKLLKFQSLSGISSPLLLADGSTTRRPAPNEGIYKRTVDEENKVRFQYNISSYVVSVGGMLQIVVGAALTALGAANGPSAIVTIFGAVNTVIAGLLTYLKGQGLPTRLEQYLHLLRTLREHIEEREREFLEPGCELDVDEEIKGIAKMYQEVRQTAQDNAPGTVLPPRGAITSLLKKPDVDRADVMAPRGDKSPGAVLASGLQDLASFGHRKEK